MVTSDMIHGSLLAVDMWECCCYSNSIRYHSCFILVTFLLSCFRSISSQVSLQCDCMLRPNVLHLCLIVLPVYLVCAFPSFCARSSLVWEVRCCFIEPLMCIRCWFCLPFTCRFGYFCLLAHVPCADLVIDETRSCLSSALWVHCLFVPEPGQF